MSGLKKYLIICGVFLVIYLLVQYFKPKPTNWTPTYLTEDKIPFGTYILNERIKDIFPGITVKKTQNPICNTLKEKSEGNSNYLIIASELQIYKLDYKEMVNYLRAGNNIFIAAYEINGILRDSLKIKISSDFSLTDNDKYPINFSNTSLRSQKGYYFNKGISQQYFSKIDTSRAIILGTKNNNLTNFIQYKFDNGSLFIMPNPQLLTNYSLLNRAGLEYTSKALSYLPKTKILIWDVHFTRPSTEDISPLRLIFKYDQLKWAYFLSIFGLIAFVLFEIKRRQRIIPVISRSINTSIEFVKVVSRVYYQQRNNRDIAEKKVKYLLEYIRNKYRLRTLHLNQEFKDGLMRGSGASTETIESLLIAIDQLKREQMVSDHHLIDLNKIIEKFYKQDQ